MGVSKSAIPRSTVVIREVASTPPTTTEQTAEKSSDVLGSEARSENLLRRGRGRFGTILTGFQGVLTNNESQKKRKTLLGE
jgi:hypothetical protein